MLSPLRNRFGIPGVISVIALVFAMLGGAYAASDNAGSGKATSSAKAKKGPRGPKGPKGPAGPAGPQGPAGPAGAKGDSGAAGSNGSNGSNGKDGASVTGTPIAAGGACGVGVTGVKYTLGASSTNVCNGKNGTNGQTGFTEVLPPGKTEVGAWAYSTGEEGLRRLPISFNIPLAEPLNAAHVHYITPSGDEIQAFSVEPPTPVAQTTCQGDAAEPTAPPGHLCVYAGEESPDLRASSGQILQPDSVETSGAGIAGAIMQFGSLGAGGNGKGSWAVTAEEE